MEAILTDNAFSTALAEATKRGYVAAFRWLTNREAARDACQEAAARAWASRTKYNSQRPFYPWYYRILKNHCTDNLRRRQVGERVTEIVTVDPDRPRPATAEDKLVDSRRERAVNLAIQQLEEPMQEVLELRHFQGASYEEMAEVLGVPVGTIMSRLYRARKALRACLLEDPAFKEEDAQ